MDDELRRELRKAGFTFAQPDQDASAQWDAWRRGGLVCVWDWGRDVVEFLVTLLPLNGKKNTPLGYELGAGFVKPIATLWRGSKRGFLMEVLPLFGGCNDVGG